jgi:hypothetical protein
MTLPKHDEKQLRLRARLDVKLLETQSLRLVDGHKARDRTLQSMTSELSPEFMVWLANSTQEEKRRVGPFLDAKLLVQSLMLPKDDKARERTLQSLRTVHASQHPSQAAA